MTDVQMQVYYWRKALSLSSDLVKILNRHVVLIHTCRNVNRQIDIQFVKSFSTTDSVLQIEEHVGRQQQLMFDLESSM